MTHRLSILAASILGSVLLLVACQTIPSTVSAEPTLSVVTPAALGQPSGPPAHDGLRRSQQGDLTTKDGVVPEGTTVFSDIPAVTRLDPTLLKAVRLAASAAGREGITIFVNSGWRSAAYQQRLLKEAVSTYGSKAEAAKWVATPGTSAHVRGAAVDLGDADADSWLSQHGADYGLCRIYRNEAWHFELRPAAVDDGCPQMYADPTHDPRMQL